MKTRPAMKAESPDAPIPAFGSLASFSTSFSMVEKASADEKLNAMDELARPISLPTTPGCDRTVAIKLSTANQGTLRQVRQRTVGDELAASAAQAPTTRAIRMANALMLERILGTGQFKSPAALAAKLGISRSVVSELLGMLNLPPAEIERILFETRA